MSEIDVTGQVLKSFIEVKFPCHLSLAGEGRVLVADSYSHRILVLNGQLQLQRVLDSSDQTKVDLREPRRICYNELTNDHQRESLVYVLHGATGSKSPATLCTVYEL